MKSYLNRSELNALRGLSHEARTLYREAIRLYLDYATGVSGLVRRLDYKYLFTDVLRVVPDRGSSRAPYEPTQAQIRALLKELHRAGLIEQVKRNGKTLPLVFFLPKADSDLNRSDEERQVNDSDERQRLKNDFFNKNNKLDGEFVCISSEEQQQISQKNAEERHTSDNPLVINNIYTSPKPVEKVGNGWLMSRDWSPGDNAVDQCVSLGFALEFIFGKALEFRLYWVERNECRNNWDESFVWWFKKNIREREGEFMSNLAYVVGD